MRRDPTPLASVKKHGLAGYRQGCGCPKCRIDRRLDDARRAGRPAHTTDPGMLPNSPPPSGATVVETAVRADLAELDGSAGITGLSAVAIALAQQIDAQGATASAAKELRAVLAEIRKAGQQPADELTSFLTAMASSQ